ncbi:MAG: hypothetical protein RSC84_03270 [Peptostreptococcaceae bacterium]
MGSHHCLADKLESSQRIKEIDKMRSLGKKTELQEWWENLGRLKGDSPKWDHEDIAYMVQMRPLVRWKSIARVLDRTDKACQDKYHEISKLGKLEFYQNYKLKTLIWKGNV